MFFRCCGRQRDERGKKKNFVIENIKKLQLHLNGSLLLLRVTNIPDKYVAVLRRIMTKLRGI